MFPTSQVTLLLKSLVHPGCAGRDLHEDLVNATWFSWEKSPNPQSQPHLQKRKTALFGWYPCVNGEKSPNMGVWGYMLGAQRPNSYEEGKKVIHLS